MFFYVKKEKKVYPAYISKHNQNLEILLCNVIMLQ